MNIRERDAEREAQYDVFCLQTWDIEKQEKVHDDISPISLFAAREVARAHAALGYTSRIMSEDSDYNEVWTPTEVRKGTYAQTTIVRVRN